MSWIFKKKKEKKKKILQQGYQNNLFQEVFTISLRKSVAYIV